MSSKPKVGDRVGAICSADGDTIQIYGYGVYEGNFCPVESAGPMANMLIDNKIVNPRIRLDNGQVVYGCECWWSDEEVVKAQVAGYENVEVVSIEADRDQHR